MGPGTGTMRPGTGRMRPRDGTMRPGARARKPRTGTGTKDFEIRDQELVAKDIRRPGLDQRDQGQDQGAGKPKFPSTGDQ